MAKLKDVKVNGRKHGRGWNNTNKEDVRLIAPVESRVDINDA